MDDVPDDFDTPDDEREQMSEVVQPRAKSGAMSASTTLINGDRVGFPSRILQERALRCGEPASS